MAPTSAPSLVSRVWALLVAEASLVAAASVALVARAMGQMGGSPAGGTIDMVLAAVTFIVIVASAFGVSSHAEALARRYGEPYGTLILTFSVIAVEVIMITTMMLHTDLDPTIARDTMFSTLMLLLNGLLGIVLVAGGLRHGEQRHNWRSSTAFLSVIVVATGLGLFLPMVLEPTAERHLHVFLVVACLALFASFTRLQTREHRGYFQSGDEPAHDHREGPDPYSGAHHAIALFATIFFISILAEDLARAFDVAVTAFELPDKTAGMAVAFLIVMPEGLTALRAGLRNQMQRVVNISLGSAVATLLLTIPAVLIVGHIAQREVQLAFEPLQAALTGMTILVAMLTFKADETNLLQGFLHLALFSAFVGSIFF